jgi:DNA-binding NtrC family response regulator
MSSPTASRVPQEVQGRPVAFAVDDEVMILELIAMVLAPHGYQLVTFDDPVRALEEVRAEPNRAALMITDFAMHSMNGMELLEKCRAVAPDLKVLLISGTVNEAVYAGAPVQPEGCLAKPFPTHQLLAKVRELIGC